MKFFERTPKRESFAERRRKAQRKEDLKNVGLVAAAAVTVGTPFVGVELQQSHENDVKWEESHAAHEAEEFRKGEEVMRIERAKSTEHPPHVTMRHHAHHTEAHQKAVESAESAEGDLPS